MEKNINIERNPLVSVLIGTYNRSNLLPRCLDSILNQNYENLEIIVINDASTDDTEEVLIKYNQKYPDKVKFYNNISNMGISFNSNYAFSKSEGKYLALIGDDDSWIDNNKLNKQIEAFDQNNNLGIVSTYWNDIENNIIQKSHKPKASKNLISQILKGNGVYCGSTALIKREAWEKVSGFDLKMKKGTDSELFRSIIIAGYETKILESFSTNVYIDKSIVRMTPIYGIKSKVISASSHFRVIWKYKIYFLKNINSFFFRIKVLIRDILR